nr:hypothetical protein [Tanacetum cinerariifolium]
MLNKENYVPWSSRLLRYPKSRPNGKLIHNSIINGLYVRRMISKPSDPNREVPVNETFHVQTNDELFEKELKQIKADDQAIQTILLCLPEDIYAVVDTFKLNYTTPTNNNQRISSNPRNRQIAQPVMNLGQDRQMQMVGGKANQNPNRNGNLIAARAEGNATGHNGNQIRCYNCRGVDGSAEVHNYENCYDNEIFNMFTQEEQYTELLEPIPEPHQVPQNDNNVISEDSIMEQSRGTVEQHPVNVKETRALYDSLYNNLVIEVEKVNTVNHKLSETNAKLTTELARYKNQERCFEISQEKYDKLGRCYQKSVYQEQCLCKKINALHLSSGKQIMTLNEEISDLNKQLSMEKSTVSSILEEKKKLMFVFKIHEDELLDKQIQLEKRIKELDNILVKTGQSIQTIHMLSPKLDSFYHTEKIGFGLSKSFLSQASSAETTEFV